MNLLNNTSIYRETFLILDHVYVQLRVFNHVPGLLILFDRSKIEPETDSLNKWTVYIIPKGHEDTGVVITNGAVTGSAISISCIFDGSLDNGFH